MLDATFSVIFKHCVKTCKTCLDIISIIPEFSFSLRKMKVETLFLFLVLISEASFIEEDDITTINPIEDSLPKNQSETFCGDFQSL